MSTHRCALRHVQVCWCLFSSAHNLLIYSCRNHCWGFAPVFSLTIKSFLWWLSQYSKELYAVLMPSGHDTHLRLSTVTSVLPVCHFLNLARSDSPASSASTMRDLDSGEKWCRGVAIVTAHPLSVCAIWSCLSSSSPCRSSCMETTPHASWPKEQIWIEIDHKKEKKSPREAPAIVLIILCGLK